MDEVAAHEQKFTHSYIVVYPAHAPRSSDPHKRDFDAWKQDRRHSGTYYCDFAHEHRGGDTSECDLKHPLEAHHRVVELAMMNEIDFKLLEKDYPGVSNPDAAGAWIDSDQNLTLLCVTGKSPILMADGSTCPIEDVQVGDLVIGRDGKSYPVTARGCKRYRGEVISFGAAAFTPEHRLLGFGQWLPASQILRQIRMHSMKMIPLRGEKNQVESGVIGAVPVKMMNSLSRKKGSSDPFFHDHNMLHYQSPAIPDANVPFRGELRSLISEIPLRESIQGGQSARIGTVATLDRPAVPAMETMPADFALAEMGWFTAMPRSTLFAGWVHDLTVAHSRAFVAGGIVAHNCTFHHRGPMGVHCASYSDYGSTYYIRDLIKGK